MSEHIVATFFYGSYMNLNVLRALDILPRNVEIATLKGFKVCIRPLANLVRSNDACVYGIVATTTHVELDLLYAHARDMGGSYLPEAVIVETADGTVKPALCYMSPDLEEKPAADDYVDRIAKPAREYGFPEAYLQRIESFRS